MCGILTVVSKDGPVDTVKCERALQLLRHRGPDMHSWELPTDKLFLGHTLLSIVDEPVNSRQPFSSSARLRLLLFNGEIYNFADLRRRFLTNQPLQTATDTEVLCELHRVMAPTDVYRQLDGMFAYVLYDRQQTCLYVGRDMIGEKSLYLFQDRSYLIVASEIPPILALVGDRTRVDRDVLSTYFLTRHWIMKPATCFVNVTEVPAGSVLKYDIQNDRLTTLVQTAIHDLVDETTYRRLSKYPVDELSGRLTSLLDENASQMIPPRRDFAAIVSGGIDSAVVAKPLAKHRQAHTFICLRHPGKDRLAYRLAPFEKVLRQPVVTVDSSAEQYAVRIRECMRHTCAPFHTHSFVSLAMIAEAIRDRSIRVLFGGDGGDELLGGYASYVNDLMTATNGLACPSAYSSIRNEYRDIFRLRNYAFEEEVARYWEASKERYSFLGNGLEMIGNAMLLNDTAHELPQVSLRQADLMGMMYGVEVRSPLVRKRVLKFALNLPLCMKLNLGGIVPHGITKPLLSYTARRLYGDWIMQPKEGFSGFPNESKVLLGDTDRYRVFDVMGISRQVWDDYSERRDVIWKLVNTEWFLREFEEFIR